MTRWNHVGLVFLVFAGLKISAQEVYVWGNGADEMKILIESVSDCKNSRVFASSQPPGARKNVIHATKTYLYLDGEVLRPYLIYTMTHYRNSAVSKIEKTVSTPLTEVPLSDIKEICKSLE